MNTRNSLYDKTVAIDLPEKIIDAEIIQPDELPSDINPLAIKRFGTVDLWNIRNKKRNTGINRNG